MQPVRSRLICTTPLTDRDGGASAPPSSIAIVGGSPSSIHLAPFDDSSWQVWALGNQLDKIKGRRVDRIFEIHDDLSNQKPGYAEWLANLGIPLVVGEKFPVQAEHIKPFDFNIETLGMYLTSSAAYMIALALHEGVTNLAVYGFDMAVDDAEYFHQRPCMEAWLGYARGRGVNVTIPDACPVLKSPYVEGRTDRARLGPFSEPDMLGAASEHQNRIDALEEQQRAIERQIAAHDGARQVYERLAKVSRAIEAGQAIEKLSDTVRMR